MTMKKTDNLSGTKAIPAASYDSLFVITSGRLCFC